MFWIYLIYCESELFKIIYFVEVYSANFIFFAPLFTYNVLFLLDERCVIVYICLFVYIEIFEPEKK